MTRPAPAVLPANAPYSQEAEEATIGSVLLNPDSFLTVASFLKPEDFFLLRHQHIWRVFHTLSERNEPLDLVLIKEELQAHNQLEAVGGMSYLLQLVSNVSSNYQTETYAKLVKRTAVRRRLMAAATDILTLATDETLTLDHVISEAEAKLFSVSDTQIKRSFVSMSEGLRDYYEHINEIVARSGVVGVPSGFRDLDALLGGFQRSDLLVFAGRPGMGKTSFLLTVALNAARRGARVAIFTMEMGVEQILQRLVAMESRINVQNLRLGRLSVQEMNRFTEVIGRLSSLPIFIDDTPALTPLDIRTKARRLAHEHGLDLIIVDYMQLMHGGGSSRETNRVQEISYISRALKELARELNVPLISAAQLSRAVEQRNDKRPVLSDLRESGSIEQDADIVMFLYRDEVYNEATEYPNQAEIIVAKHRNGPTDTITLFFEKSLTKFMDITKTPHNLSDL
ncbi:replicative DNA helicase [Aggregatilineales bacterium SYSU G02658]